MLTTRWVMQCQASFFAWTISSSMNSERFDRNLICNTSWCYELSLFFAVSSRSIGWKVCKCLFWVEKHAYRYITSTALYHFCVFSPVRNRIAYAKEQAFHCNNWNRFAMLCFWIDFYFIYSYSLFSNNFTACI